jgi:hypothetical protein
MNFVFTSMPRLLIFFFRKRNDGDVPETNTQLVSTTVSTKSVFQVESSTKPLDIKHESINDSACNSISLLQDFS